MTFDKEQLFLGLALLSVGILGMLQKEIRLISIFLISINIPNLNYRQKINVFISMNL